MRQYNNFFVMFFFISFSVFYYNIRKENKFLIFISLINIKNINFWIIDIINLFFTYLFFYISSYFTFLSHNFYIRHSLITPTRKSKLGWKMTLAVNNCISEKQRFCDQNSKRCADAATESGRKHRINVTAGSEGNSATLFDPKILFLFCNYPNTAQSNSSWLRFPLPNPQKTSKIISFGPDSPP